MDAGSLSGTRKDGAPGVDGEREYLRPYGEPAIPTEDRMSGVAAFFRYTGRCTGRLRTTEASPFRS